MARCYKNFSKERNPANLAIANTLAKNWEEARVNVDFAQLEDPNLYPVGRNRYDVIPRLDSYGRDLYAPVSNNPLSIEGPPPIPIINPKPLAIREPIDPIMDSISKLEKFFTELAILVIAGRIKGPKSTNQRTNVWCSNCKGHDHLPTECPTPLGINIQNNPYTFCGGNHYVNKCWNLGEVVAQVQAQNSNQWNQRKNTKLSYSVTSKRPFTRPNVGSPYKPNDGQPCWNDNYNAPPVWNGPPYNPNTYRYGPPQKDIKHVDVANSAIMLMNVQIPKKRGYTLVCGNCRQMGHTAKECNAKPRNFPPSERDYKENQPKLPPNNSRDVNCITQHMPFEQDMFTTRAGTRLRKVTEESDQESEPKVIFKALKKERILLLGIQYKLMNWTC